MEVETTKMNFVAAATNKVAGSTNKVAGATKMAAAAKIYKEVNQAATFIGVDRLVFA